VPALPEERSPDGVAAGGTLGFDWNVVPAVHAQLDDPERRSWTVLATITAPTLLVAGGPASHVPQELLVDVSERIADCTLVTIPVGHTVHAAASATYIEVVERWLRSAS